MSFRSSQHSRSFRTVWLAMCFCSVVPTEVFKMFECITSPLLPFQKSSSLQSICRFLAWPGMLRHENEPVPQSCRRNHKIHTDTHCSGCKTQNPKKLGASRAAQCQYFVHNLDSETIRWQRNSRYYTEIFMFIPVQKWYRMWNVKRRDNDDGEGVSRRQIPEHPV
jgi:hypothetical protein